MAEENDELATRVVRLTAELAEKNLLLKEGYRRIKNNLQVVNSLIQLRGRQIDDLAVRAAFEETSQRIRAMSLVHETLYLGADTARINFSAYLRTIAEASATSYGMAERIAVAVADNADEVDLKDAVPLGLAAVEAITNVFKHAFPGDRKGRLSISFRGPKLDLEGELIVRDDGVGMLERLGIGPSGAGLSLAAALARQVGGRVVTESNNGTLWRLCFAGVPKIASVTEASC